MAVIKSQQKRGEAFTAPCLIDGPGLHGIK